MRESFPRFRADKLHFRDHFDAVVARETGLRRKEFFRFVGAQSLYAVSQAGDDVTLDMRGIAELARRMFERELLIRRILGGGLYDDD